MLPKNLNDELCFALVSLLFKFAVLISHLSFFANRGIGIQLLCSDFLYSLVLNLLYSLHPCSILPCPIRHSERLTFIGYISVVSHPLDYVWIPPMYSIGRRLEGQISIPPFPLLGCWFRWPFSSEAQLFSTLPTSSSKKLLLSGLERSLPTVIHVAQALFLSGLPTPCHIFANDFLIKFTS